MLNLKKSIFGVFDLEHIRILRSVAQHRPAQNNRSCRVFIKVALVYNQAKCGPNALFRSKIGLVVSEEIVFKILVMIGQAFVARTVVIGDFRDQITFEQF